MPVLFLLIPLAVGALAMFSLDRDFSELRRVGMGGSDEDLSRARAVMRRLSLTALVLLIVLIALVVGGERMAGEWRRSLVATWALNALIVALAWGLVRGAWRTHRNQWSRDGTYAGMFMGMSRQAIFLVLLIPAVHWRLGSF